MIWVVEKAGFWYFTSQTYKTATGAKFGPGLKFQNYVCARNVCQTFYK